MIILFHRCKVIRLPMNFACYISNSHSIPYNCSIHHIQTPTYIALLLFISMYTILYLTCILSRVYLWLLISSVSTYIPTLFFQISYPIFQRIFSFNTLESTASF